MTVGVRMIMKFLSAIYLALLLTSMFASALGSQPLRANGTIYKTAESFTNSPTAPTQRNSGVSTQDTVDWWPMFHHDLAHSGYSTSTGPATNQTLWSFTTGNGVYSSPAVVSGVVYVGSGNMGLSYGHVYALNARTGAQVWNYTTGGLVGSSPAVVGGVVYVGSYDGKVYALNATTGALIWRYIIGGYVWSSPAVVGGVVYVGSQAGKVYALNAATGALVWNYTTGDWVETSPAVVGGVVYVGSDDHTVYALNATTGALIWRYITGGYAASSAAVANGRVYIGSCDGNVYALNAATGAPVWIYTTGSAIIPSPAVAGGLVFVGSFVDHKVYALNASTGALVWSYTTRYYVNSSPAVAGGLVFVGSEDDTFYALNAATGALVWSYTTGGWVESSPAVAGGVVYVGSLDGKVYAFGVLHDLAVVNVIPTQRLILPGNGINITVQVKNQGGYHETSNVTLYAGSTLLGAHYGIFLNPGELATFAFGWNTAAFSPGCYFLKASVAPVPYEADLGNNIDVNGTIIIGVQTPTGTNVTVSPAPNLQLIFTQTTTAGVTTLNVTRPSSTTLTAAANSVFVNIQTNATYSGNVTLQFAYNTTGLTLEDQKAIKIWLWNQTSSTWRDITTYVNTTSNIVYGVSPHLSMFGVTCTLSLTGYNGYQIPTTVGTPLSPPSLPNYLEDLAYFDIQATTQYASPVTVRLAYDPSTISPEQVLFLQMWVWDETKWVDITTKVDTISHVVCGVSPHLSMFGVTTFNSQIVTGATPVAGIAGINGYKLLFKETVGNPFSSPASIDYYWSFNIDKWNGEQWVAAGISGSSAPVAGYSISALATVDLPYYVYVLPSAGPNAVGWCNWLKISFTFHWTYSSTSYSTAYTAKLHVHPADIAGVAVAFPYLGADGKVGTSDLHVLGVAWGQSSVGADPTSDLARADFNGDGAVGTKDLNILGVEWGQNWTNTPPPG